MEMSNGRRHVNDRTRGAANTNFVWATGCKVKGIIHYSNVLVCYIETFYFIQNNSYIVINIHMVLTIFGPPP